MPRAWGLLFMRSSLLRLLPTFLVGADRYAALYHSWRALHLSIPGLRDVPMEPCQRVHMRRNVRALMPLFQRPGDVRALSESQAFFVLMAIGLLPVDVIMGVMLVPEMACSGCGQVHAEFEMPRRMETAVNPAFEFVFDAQTHMPRLADTAPFRARYRCMRCNHLHCALDPLANHFQARLPPAATTRVPTNSARRASSSGAAPRSSTATAAAAAAPRRVQQRDSYSTPSKLLRWFLAIGNRSNCAQRGRESGLSDDTERQLMQRMQLAFFVRRQLEMQQGVPLRNIVIDELYVGAPKYKTGRPQRTSSSWVVTLTETVGHCGRALRTWAFPVRDRTSDTLLGIMKPFLLPNAGTTVVSDAWQGYKLVGLYASHFSVNHKQAFVVDNAHTNTAESINALQRRMAAHFFGGFGSNALDLQLRLAFNSEFLGTTTLDARLLTIVDAIGGDNLRLMNTAHIRLLGGGNRDLLPRSDVMAVPTANSGQLVTDGTDAAFLPPGTTIRPEDVLMIDASMPVRGVHAFVTARMRSAVRQGRSFVVFGPQTQLALVRVLAFVEYRRSRNRLSDAAPDPNDPMLDPALGALQAALRLGATPGADAGSAGAANVLLPIVVVGVDVVGQGLSEFVQRERFEASVSAARNRVAQLQGLQQLTDRERARLQLAQSQLAAIDAAVDRAVDDLLAEDPAFAGAERYGPAAAATLRRAMQQELRDAIFRSLSTGELSDEDAVDVAAEQRHAQGELRRLLGQPVDVLDVDDDDEEDVISTTINATQKLKQSGTVGGWEN